MRVARPFIFVLLFAAPALSQPAGLNRVLRTFDFEERRLGNSEDLPMRWAKVEGNGFPHYVNARLATDRARSGRYGFRFDLNGGSLLYRYDAGLIPARPGAHYRIEAWAQTTVMPHARARMTAYFVDADGHPLRASIRHSEPYAAKGEGEPWKQLAIDLSCDDARAASLVLELGLLQPSQYAGNTLGQRTLFAQDVRGSAWFDDVSVSQIPKVKLGTDRPANVFRRSDPLRLNVSVNDRFTDDLAAQLVIRDALGRTIFQRSGAAEMSADLSAGTGGAAGAAGEKRMALALPDLPPGWYEVSLVMSSGGQRVGDRKLSLVRLGDDGEAAAPPDARFGVIATDLPFEGWAALPDVLPLLGASRVKLAVWTSAGDVEQLDPAAFDRMLVRLGELRIRPTACLLALPPTIARKLQRATSPLDGGGSSAGDDPGADGSGAPRDDRDALIHLLKARPEDWQPELAYLLAKHASHLDRWQLGADGTEAFVNQKGMRGVYDMVYGEFAKLIHEPDLAMPWPAWYELDGKLPATVALAVPANVLPGQLPSYMQEIKGAQGHNLSLTLAALDREPYGRDVQIRDLAQRVIYALAAGASRIDIPLSFTMQRDGDELVDRPLELFLIVRTLMTTLRGGQFKGKVPIAEGVEAFLFERPDGEGVLALWDTGRRGDAADAPRDVPRDVPRDWPKEEANDGVRSLALALGDNPTRIDLWGNASPLLRVKETSKETTPAERDRLGDRVRVRLGVGTMPIFLGGIDSPLLQLRASAGFDRPLLESSFRQHARRFRFKNPYRQAISGAVRLRGPAGWTITPAFFNYSLNPGEMLDREITLEFPYNSSAGTKTVAAEFLVQGDKTTAFTMPLTLKLGLSDVGMQTLALRSGRDLVVQQIVQNYGDAPINYTAFALVPGQPRQERLVTNLAAGQTTIKRYRFVNATLPAGGKVRVGIRETEGTRILNDEVEVQ